ncbi:MAG: 3-oxoacyl-ACP synthase [Gemmatimonadetes bacterium]|nr:3-oxoacyl-ACP synthase [Gemmatimonadota bacterium]
MKSYIKGMGTYVPDRIVTNDDLAKRFDTSDEWIRQRTGIEERRYAEEGIGTSDLAKEAAVRAAADAGIEIEQIDFIILGTLSPDHHFPGTACYLQPKLELAGVPCLDIRQQCTGWVYGMTLADSLIKTGPYQNILLVGSEVHSHALHFDDAGRDVTVIFGDGAGAAIVSPAPEGSERGVLAHALHADGRHADRLCYRLFDISRIPLADAEYLESVENAWPYMEGRHVFKEAVVRMPEVVREVLASTGHTIDDIDLLVPHQANLRINEYVVSSLGIAPEKVINNIQRFGNTTAASIPIALDEARRNGQVSQGDLVCLVAFGAGFTWGAVTLRL